MLCLIPKITVIIPVYNVEQYLEECLESVINQTLKDIEIICVDDGSTDNSWIILKKYASQYKNMILMNQMNSGAGAARNKALKIAKGEFAAFMDGDDYYPSNDVLEALYNSAKANNVLISGGSYSRLNHGCISFNFRGFGKKLSFHSDKIIKYAEYQFAYGFYRFIFNLNMLRENNIYFPEYRRYQDPPFLVKAMCVAGEFYGMEKMAYIHRKGIRVIQWTPKKMEDAMKGILDLLNISRELKFSILHTNTVEDLYNGFLVAIIQHLIDGNLRIEKLAQQINQAMDRDLLKQENRSIDKYYIPNISNAIKVIRETQAQEGPFVDYLKTFNEVVIYGAGHVGEMVVAYLKQIPEINIKCFAVSPGMTKPNSVSGIAVKTINELTSERERVLVLIATFDDIQQEIKNILENLNFRYVLPINFKDFRFYGIAV